MNDTKIILDGLIRDAILSEEEQSLINEMKKEIVKRKVDSVHKNTICFNEKQSLFFTVDPTDKKKKVRAKTEEKLYEKLYLLYFGEETFSIAELFYPALEERKGIAAATRRVYIRIYKKYLKDSAYGKTPLKEAKVSDLKKYLYSFSGAISSHDIRNLKTVINLIYEYGVMNDLVPINCAMQFTTRGIKTIDKPIDYEDVYTMEDRQKFLSVSMKSDDIYDMACSFQWFVGNRESETLALRYEDIDFERKSIFFHGKIAEVPTKKGYRFDYVPFTKTNSRKGDHFNPLSPEAEAIIRRVSEKTKKNEGLVFIGKTGNHLYAQRMREHFKALCEKAGIKYRGIHSERHLMDTELKKYLGSFVTGSLMGHSAEMVDRYERITDRPDIQAAWEKVTRYSDVDET